MRSRGIGGFGVIILIIIFLIVGYIVWQIARVHLTHGSIVEKVEHATRIGPAMTNEEIVNQLIREAKEAKIELSPDSIFIDRSIPDSFRIYVAYSDSSDILGAFTYRKNFQIDIVQEIEIRF